MVWEENSRICLHMQLIAILSRIGVNNYIDNQIDCLYKAIERYEILLRNLNGSSLDEAIQAYTHVCDKKNY